MARQLVVTWNDATSTFDLRKLERRRLYGVRRRVPLDTDGAPCQRAALTRDGAFLLRPGMTAQGYYTAGGAWVPQAELGGIDAEGREVERVESTLGVPQPLDGPLPPRALLDLAVTSVYVLDGVALDPALDAALDRGELFRAPFQYRAGFDADAAFLVRNDEGTFALVGKPTAPAWVEPAAPPPDLDDDDLGDELDFEMF